MYGARVEFCSRNAALSGGTVTTADGSASVGNWAFFHSDPVQSTSLVTDGAGKLAAQINHLPYGGVDAAHSVGSAEALKQWASYTGQEHDPETGLIYYKFRYYDPSLRRFTSPDNMIPEKGRNPQAFNRYAYVLGNPVDFNDPSGHGIDWCRYMNTICKAWEQGKKDLTRSYHAQKDAMDRNYMAAQRRFEKNRVAFVASVDNRRAEITHILGLDNLGLGMPEFNGLDTCLSHGTCFDSTDYWTAPLQRDYNSFREWGQNHLRQKGTWLFIGGAIALGCTLATGGAGLSSCMGAGGFVAGYGYARSNGASRRDSFFAGVQWGAIGTAAGLAGMAGMAYLGAMPWEGAVAAALSSAFIGTVLNYYRDENAEDGDPSKERGAVGIYNRWGADTWPLDSSTYTGWNL